MTPDDDDPDPKKTPKAPLPPVAKGPMDVPLPASAPRRLPDLEDTSGYPAERPQAPPPPPVRAPPPVESVFGLSESGPATGVPRAVGASTTTVPSTPMRPYDELNELRDAVGAAPVEEEERSGKRKKRKADEDEGEDGPRPRRKKTWLVIAVTTFVGLGTAALVILGYINGGRYEIACESEQIVAVKGRTFPPWGTRAMGGELWKPIKIPANAECRARDTEDEYELAGWYLELLVDRASTLLTAREVTNVDQAAGMLEQALLHARAPERRDQRKEIERLLGDVGYWRASAKLKDAANALGDAAKQFDTAATQRPRHVSDASAWAAYARKVAEQLRAGPAEGKSAPAAPNAPATPERPAAPTGVALPVEPGSGSGSATAPPAAPPDAGVPTGGVLL